MVSSNTNRLIVDGRAILERQIPPGSQESKAWLVSAKRVLKLNEDGEITLHPATVRVMQELIAQVDARFAKINEVAM